MTKPKRTPLPDDVLVQLWHSPKTLREIAFEIDWSQEQVSLAFTELRRDGKIPQDIYRSGKRIPPQVLANGARPGNDSEGRPSSKTRHGNDPLLDKLREVHCEPRYDFYPGYVPNRHLTSEEQQVMHRALRRASV